MGLRTLVRQLGRRVATKSHTMSDFPWENEWPEITDQRVRAAFARVLLVRPSCRRTCAQWSHCDAPLPIGEGQTISQPFVVALMTQALELRAGRQGAGDRHRLRFSDGHSGGTGGRRRRQKEKDSRRTVYSVERHAALSEQCGSESLHRQGYEPHLRVGDGAAGWPSEAPFDAIILSAAPPMLAPSTLGSTGRWRAAGRANRASSRMTRCSGCCERSMARWKGDAGRRSLRADVDTDCSARSRHANRFEYAPQFI